MDEIKVIWSKNALAQRNDIFDYWNHRNKSNTHSKKINLIIYKKIELLKINPLIGILGDLPSYRILHFGKYSLIYKTYSNMVYIIAVWDNRQNPDKLKKLLGL